MQKIKAFFRRIGTKGYYIALGVCALAVAVSALFYVRSLGGSEETPAPETGPEVVALPTLPQVPSPERPDTEREAAALDPEPAREPKPALIPPQREIPDAPEVPAVRTPEETELPAGQEEAPEEPAGAVQTEAAQPALQPVQPLQGTVSKPYSMDRLSFNLTTRDWRTHPGLDIAAALGSPVRAAADGTVLSVYEDDSLGQTVTLRHVDGWVTHYANLDREVPVSVGDAVRAGQIIGAVGRTALSEIGSEPHLHFAVYQNNVPQDPEEFLEP